MSLIFVKRSTLPVARLGKEATNKITITGNGQIQFSKLAIEWLGKPATTVMGVDGGKVYFFKPDAKAVAKVEEKDRVELKYGKKSTNAYFAGASMLRSADVFGTHLYDFKASGNQSFVPVMDEKNDALVIDLPNGALAAKPVVKRVPKVKAVGSVVETTDELVLDAA